MKTATRDQRPRAAAIGAHRAIPARKAWLPRVAVAPKLSAFFIISAALLFFGIYTAIDYNIGKEGSGGGTIPMVSAFPGVLIMLIQPGIFSPRLVRFILIPTCIVAVFALLGPSLSTAYLNRLAAIAQTGYSMVIGYCACWALQRIGANRLHRLLRVLIPVYLILLTLEVALKPMQELVRVYQDAVYPVHFDQDLLADREAGMGGYRPKFFTSEASFIAITMMLLVPAYLWTGRDIKRYFYAVAFAVFGLLIIRSPIVVSLILVIVGTMMADPHFAKYRTVVGTFVISLGALAAAGAFVVAGDVIQNRINTISTGEDFSTTLRTYGSFEVAVTVAKKYPLFGAGPGGIDLVKTEIVQTLILVGVPFDAVEEGWRYSIGNAPSSLLISFGLIGFALGSWLLVSFIQREVPIPRGPTYILMACWCMSYAGVYTPKFLVTTIVIVTLAGLASRQTIPAMMARSATARPLRFTAPRGRRFA